MKMIKLLIKPMMIIKIILIRRKTNLQFPPLKPARRNEDFFRGILASGCVIFFILKFSVSVSTGYSQCSNYYFYKNVFPCDSLVKSSDHVLLIIRFLVVEM